MRIKVYTFYWGKNFGAMLQAWALKRVLEGLGHAVSFAGRPAFPLKWRFRNWKQRPEGSILRKTKWILNRLFTEFLAIGTEDVRYWRLRNFHRHFLGSAQTGWSASDCNCAVFGSDQIWNPSLTEEDARYYLGETIPAAIPKISYAASVGDGLLSHERKSRLVRACASFAALSIREPVSALFDRLGRPPSIAMDPTLLLSREDYREMECPKRLHKGHYILVFALSLTQSVLNVARNAARSIGLPVVYVTTNYYGRRWLPVCARLSESPERLLAYIRDADYVVTSSFHGTVFSLIYRKRFVSIVESANPIGTRVYSLLNAINMADRVVDFSDSTDLKKILSKDVANLSLSMLRDKVEMSHQWLRRVLEELIGDSHG